MIRGEQLRRMLRWLLFFSSVDDGATPQPVVALIDRVVVIARGASPEGHEPPATYHVVGVGKAP